MDNAALPADGNSKQAMCWTVALGVTARLARSCTAISFPALISGAKRQPTRSVRLIGRETNLNSGTAEFKQALHVRNISEPLTRTGVSTRATQSRVTTGLSAFYSVANHCIQHHAK